MAFTITGGAALKTKMEAIKKSVTRDQVADGMREAASMVADAVRAEAPKDTGRLADSVIYGVYKERAGKPTAAFVTLDMDKTRRVKNGIPYAIAVEQGLAPGTSPNPFFERGVGRSRAGARAKLIDTYEAAVAKAI